MKRSLRHLEERERLLLQARQHNNSTVKGNTMSDLNAQLNQAMAEACETVNAWVFIGKGQAGFEWQHDTLVQYKDQHMADALATWWSTHPGNSVNA